MNMTHYFIEHPVITLILNAMITFIGYLSLDSLQLRVNVQKFISKEFKFIHII